MTNQAVLSASQLSKSFTDGQLKTDVLNNINLTVNRSDRIAIVGSSGSVRVPYYTFLAG